MRLRLISPALALIAAVQPGCKNGDRRDPEKSAPSAGFVPARVAELYFSTEVDGYIEPCGCTTKPLGGVQRLATVLESGHAERALIDAGNLLFPNKVDSVTREQHLLKSRVLARVYRRLGAVAINVAQNDLTEGTELLKEMQREGAVPFVSANVRPVGDTGPSIARSVMRTIGDIKIGITGIATPESVSNKEGIAAIEYGPALRSEIATLRKEGAEVIIVLAHAGELGAKELAKAIPDIDIIVRAPGTPIEREPSAPIRANGVLIVEAGSQGQHVGRITLSFGSETPERPLLLDDAGQSEVKARAMIERRIKAYRMEADAWSVDPAKADAVKAKLAEIDRLQAKLKEPLPAPVPPNKAHLRVELIKLTEEIASHTEMTTILSAYYADLRAMNLEKGDVAQCAIADKAKPVYVGTERCTECHQEEHAFWKKTKHAKAWATLEEQGKHFDLTCIGCHTVGYQQAGGFCRLKDVGALKDVGCESCHGPGSVHVEDQEPSSITLAVPEKTCMSLCHVPDHSDGFVYEKYLREITGKGHELSAGGG